MIEPRPTNLESRTDERIAKEFPAGQQQLVKDLLISYAGPEPDRVRWDILELSKGDLQKVRHYSQDAQRDYRDILYWAEYYSTDPLLKKHDPKKLVDDIIAKWGQKN